MTTPHDHIRMRTVKNQISLIEEHLEAMQRDSHGLEYAPWKHEVDIIWKSIFDQISKMSQSPQHTALEMVRELWSMYLAHYATKSR